MKVIRLTLGIATFWGAVWLGTTANGQTIRVDHRTRTDINFAAISPGDRVAENPNYVWGHDGTSWTWICVNPYACNVPIAPSTNKFSAGQELKQPYPSYRAVVVGVAQDQGKEIVTARITRTGGWPAVGSYITFDAANTYWSPINSLP